MSNHTDIDKIDDLANEIKKESDRRSLPWYRFEVTYLTSVFFLMVFFILLEVSLNTSIVILLLLGVFGFLIDQKGHDMNKELDKDILDTMIVPFLQSLEEKKTYIEDVSYDNEGDLYYSYVIDERDRIYDYEGKEITQRDDAWGSLLLEHGKMPILYDLPSGAQPYRSYRKLDKDIGEYLKKGVYLEEIHLPEDYPKPPEV